MVHILITRVTLSYDLINEIGILYKMTVVDIVYNMVDWKQKEEIVLIGLR